MREEGFAREVAIDDDPALRRYVVEKGSIALDGVSLTVARSTADGFDGLADPRDAASARRSAGVGAGRTWVQRRGRTILAKHARAAGRLRHVSD